MMRIEVDVDTDDGRDSLVFTNENLNNPLYVTLLTDDSAHDILIDDLRAVVVAFGVAEEDYKRQIYGEHEVGGR